MSGDGEIVTCFCNLCEPPHRILIADLVEHLAVVHGYEADVSTWPDGSPVIVDKTLEPDDFRQAPSEEASNG